MNVSPENFICLSNPLRYFNTRREGALEHYDLDFLEVDHNYKI